MTLHIPDGISELDNLAAALAYADAGWYVLPVNPKVGDGKHPGSVVKDNWQSQSSRDPKVIAGWFAGTDYGIALHCGRSGAVILDVDDPEAAHDAVALVMESGGPYQSTRPDQPGRGHYLLANDTGRRIGNGLGRLATEKKWGEVRGANGVIIVAPSVHPAGGLYRWIRTGALPGLPDYIDEALPNSTTPEATATDAEIEKFLNTHTEATKPEMLAGLVTTLTGKLSAGHSCHMSTLGILVDAMGEAAAGYYDARTATRELWAVYHATATTGTSTGRVLTNSKAASDYRGIVAWAVGQAETGAQKARERIGARFTEATTIEVTAEDIAAPVEVTAPLEAIEEQFWTSRESLTLIYDAALSKMCAPWAVLACCVARTLALIPPDVVLPDVIGGLGSLNWFGALVAKSGGGKGAANAVASQLVPGDIVVRGAGSGEGMIEAYNRKADPQDHVTAILFSVDEVDSIASMQARSGQTTMSVIRSGFSGETLGYSYRGRAGEKVDAHSYRMTMIVSVQPERAGGLFSDASGGTPQRFMWFPARDRRVKSVRPTWPTDSASRRRILPPVDHRALPFGGMSIPPEAEALILQAREASMSGDDNALDGHAVYCREKFAYALAIFDGRTTMNSDDWKLAGIAGSVSDWCRLRAQNALAKAETSMAAERGRLRGIESYEADISRSVIAGDDIKRILKWAVGKLRAADGGRMAKPKLKSLAAGRDRVKVVEAMLSGVEAGLIIGDADEWVLL